LNDLLPCRMQGQHHRLRGTSGWRKYCWLPCKF
jgi:hypothetical protein